MIVLFTDFGLGPYVGQMQAAIYRVWMEAPIIHLMHDVPCYRSRAAAYLLATYPRDFPRSTVFLCVVDPGVGDPSRQPVVVQIDEQWFVGPDNGLFDVLAMRSREMRWWSIVWRPQYLSASFHGRDLFAPIAAHLARGDVLEGVLAPLTKQLSNAWPGELAEIIYIDHYGNAMTGIRASGCNTDVRLHVDGAVLCYARTFAEVPVGHAFWYENANGLVEIAVNQGSAAELLRLSIGDNVWWDIATT